VGQQGERQLRTLLTFLTCLFFAGILAAQNTTVTATVTGPNGVIWAQATGSAQLICPGNAQAYRGSTPVPRNYPIPSLDSTASFTQVLVDTTGLVDANANPISCQYQYGFTDQCGIAGFTTGLLTGITGPGPINLTAQIHAYTPNVSPQCTGGNNWSSITGFPPACAANTFVQNISSGACVAAAWSGLTSGTNTTSAFLCGTGCTFGPTGSGTVTATAAPWAGLTGVPANCTSGQFYNSLVSGTCASGGSAPTGNTNDVQVKSATGILAPGCINSPASPSTTSFNCDSSFTGPNPYIDIRAYGARACSNSSAPCAAGVTGSITSGTNTLTLNTASTFVNGDGIVVYGAGSASGLSTPSAPTVTTATAAMGVGTDLTVAGAAAGSTTKCYKIIARTTGGGYTPASPETCISTGQATLGIVTVNLTSCSRGGTQGTVVTCVTSTPHPLLVTNTNSSEVYIGGMSGTIDNSFRGWRRVDIVTDSTHFQYTDTVVSGAGASTTGGTASFFVSNHVTWSPVSGAWLYYIYCGASGAETLCGVSRAQDIAESVNFTTWDDFTNLQGNFSFPAWIPTTPPAVGANNNLATTITSGAGTTSLVLGANAGATVSGVGVRLDAGVAYHAACSASSALNRAPIFIPETPFNTYFVINNYTDCTLGSGFGTGLTWIQSGEMWLNETLALGGLGLMYRGNVIHTGGDVGGGQSNWGNYPKTWVGPAQPGIYLSNAQNFTVRGINMQAGANNGELLMLSDTANGNFNGYFEDDTFVSGLSSSDLYGYGLIVRGLSGVSLDRLAAGGGVSSDGATHTAGMFCNACGDLMIKNAYSSHNGFMYYGGAGGAAISLEADHYNGGFMPLLSIDATGPVVVTLGHEGFDVIMDTVGHPCVESVGQPILINNRNCNPSGYNPFTSPAITGNVQASVTAETLQYNFPNYQTILNAFIASGNEYVGKSLVYQLNGPGAIETDPASAIFVQGGGVVAPTCSVSSGGSVAFGAWRFVIVPVWWNGKEGNQSGQSTTCTTSSGNQTITVNWTIPSGFPYAMDLLANVNGGGTGLVAQYPTTQTSVVLTTIAGGSSPSGFPLGGPNMLSPSGVSASFLTYEGVGMYMNLPTGHGVVEQLDVSTTQNSQYDNFNGRGSLGSNWAQLSSTANMNVGSNVASGGGGVIAAAGWTASLFSPDQFSQVVLPTPPGSNSAGVGVRSIGHGVNGSPGQFYGYFCEESSTTLSLFKWYSNGQSTLNSTAITAAAGDVLRMEVLGQNLTCTRNRGAQILTATDTGNPINTSIFNQSEMLPSIISNDSSVTLDNWSGGNLHPIGQLDTEQDWTQPQHFSTVTIGATNPIAGTLTYGSLYNNSWTPSSPLCSDANSSAVTSGCGITITIASGTASLGTSSISSATCATAVTVAGAGIATTDAITFNFNGDPTGITGYAPSASGTLYIYAYPTAGNVNFKVCNNTSGSITPGAATLNWRVTR
jgi:hypothetical protein